MHSITEKTIFKTTKYEGFKPEGLLKIANEADQTDLEKQKQNVKEAGKQSKLTIKEFRRMSKIFD